jgi:hypothetical protein
VVSIAVIATMVVGGAITGFVAVVLVFATEREQCAAVVADSFRSLVERGEMTEQALSSGPREVSLGALRGPRHDGGMGGDR